MNDIVFKSILVDISEQIWQSDNLEESKKLIIEKVNSSKIETIDKYSIIDNLKKISNKKELDTYLGNSILFFEGLSINNAPGYKPAKGKSKNYFTQETEDAIIAYNLSTDPVERSKIYNDKIHYAFFKLTQNIIHTFKFYYTEVENIEDLQHEIIVFLLSKIHLFDSSKGTKAYSYFGTIVKRWLILYNEKNYKKRVNSVPVAILEEDNGHSYVIEENNSPSDKLSHNDKIALFTDLFIEHCTSNIYVIFPKEYDAKIADAILELFRKRDNLEVFNKKALYIYIREMIDVKTPKITKIADRLYEVYKKGYIFYLENGYIKF